MISDPDFLPTSVKPAYAPPISVKERPNPKYAVREKPVRQDTKSHFNKRAVLATLLVLAGITALATGLAVPLLQNPHVLIASYIPVAIIFKQRSQTSFTVALLLLLAIPVLVMLGQQGLAETYAVLCFYFLVLGVLMAAFETRNFKRRIPS